MALHLFDGTTYLGSHPDEEFDAEAAFPGVTITKITGSMLPDGVDARSVSRSGATISYTAGTSEVAAAEGDLARSLALGLLVAVDAISQIVDHFHYAETGLPSNVRAALDGIRTHLMPLVTVDSSNDLAASAVGIQRAVEILTAFPSATPGTIDGTIVP